MLGDKYTDTVTLHCLQASTCTLYMHVSRDLLQECETCSFTGSRINDIRVIGIMIVLVLFLVALIGLDWEAKVSLSLSQCVCVWGGGGVNNMPIVLVVSFACTNTVHTFLQVQLVLLVILLIAIADFLIGTFIPRGFDSQDRDRGFMGYSGKYMLIITCVCVYIIVTVCVITLLKLWH